MLGLSSRRAVTSQDPSHSRSISKVYVRYALYVRNDCSSFAVTDIYRLKAGLRRTAFEAGNSDGSLLRP